MPVIQFFDIDKMIHELKSGDVVRIEPIRFVSQRHHVIELTTFGVAVRHVNNAGHILAAFIPTWHGQVWPDEPDEKHEDRQAKTEDVLTKLTTYLLSNLLDVRHGLHRYWRRKITTLHLEANRMITHATLLLTIKTSEVECIDCGEWLPKSEAIYCNCEPPDLLPVCEECYTLHKHYQNDTNPENDRRRSHIQMSHEQTKNN